MALFYGDDPAVMTPPPARPEEVVPASLYLTTVLSLEAALEEIRRLDALYQSLKP